MNAGAPDDWPGRRVDRATVWMAAAASVVLALVPLRVAQLQVAPGEGLRSHIPARTTSHEMSARRGDVLDRRGRVLAATRDGYRLFVDPTLFRPPYGQAISAIADAIGMDSSEVGERIVGRIIDNRDRALAGRALIRYVPIGGMLDPEALERARALDLPGVHLERRSVREVVGPRSLASVIGKVGLDDRDRPVGRAGAELSYNDELRPEPGRLEYVRDARGRPMWIEPAGYRPARAGHPVRLSIDEVVQTIAQQEIERATLEADAAGGRVVIADPLTGEILAMVDHIRDMPGLVPAEPGSVSRHDEGVRYRTIAPDPMRDSEPALARNRCVEDVYEPGSTMKPFVWAALTERGLVGVDEVLDVHDGVWRTDFGRMIRDVTPRDELTWHDVLVYSSNIGMAQGALRAPGSTLRDDLVRFGFGVRTGVGLSGESPGLVTPASRWNHWTATSVCSGYEIAVTPVQMVRAFCAFARTGELAGTLPTLRLLALPDASWAETGDVLVRVVPASVAEDARRAMVDVAARMEQSARRHHPEDPDVGCMMFGKSGTAEIANPAGGGYLRGQHNSSFIGAAPAAHPRIVVLVVIDDPGPELVDERMHFGSQVAGPVVRRIMRRVLGHMGVVRTPLASVQPASLSSP